MIGISCFLVFKSVHKYTHFPNCPLSGSVPGGKIFELGFSSTPATPLSGRFCAGKKYLMAKLGSVDN